LSRVQLAPLVLAAALVPAQVALCGVRWGRIAAALGSHIPARRAVAEYALSTLLNQVLPGGMAGDAVRVWRRRHHEALGGAVQAALVDRWIGQWVHAVVTLLGVVVVGGMTERSAVAVWLVVLTAVVGLPGAFGSALRRAIRVEGAGMTALSAGLTASFLLGFALCGMALGEAPGLWVLAGVPLVLLAMSVPLSVGGWGLREATAVVVLPRFGWTPEGALALSALYGLTSLVGALPGGLALLEADA
ncbi:MAG: flippase-like domain-containing protein, partial [Myxococcales bacterium]|nr:flippase-like domain-containing protein [Myxococcales bacterium]